MFKNDCDNNCISRKDCTETAFDLGSFNKGAVPLGLRD